MITIIDYNAGNIRSIVNMFKRIGVASIITKDKEEISRASKIVLPGVGHFDYGMSQLRVSGLIPILEKKVLEDKVPFLGICLGAQMMGNGSEEGSEPGLGWIDMDIIKFSSKDKKVPHMGWNEVEISQKQDLIKSDTHERNRYYFVHSYYMKPKDSSNVLTKTVYGSEFVSGVVKDTIFGVQFHPEKSHKYGMKLLTNFSNIGQ